MTELERELQGVIGVVKELAVAQKVTTKNVDRITSDVGKLVGHSTEIALIKKDVAMLKAAEATRKKILVSVITFLLVAALGTLFKIKG